MIAITKNTTPICGFFAGQPDLSAVRAGGSGSSCLLRPSLYPLPADPLRHRTPHADRCAIACTDMHRTAAVWRHRLHGLSHTDAVSGAAKGEDHLLRLPFRAFTQQTKKTKGVSQNHDLYKKYFQTISKRNSHRLSGSHL